MNKPLILVVEDDLAVARLISTTLETRNYQYHRVQNGAGALLEAASARPDVILLTTAELISEFNDSLVISDEEHHPKEILEIVR